MVVYCRLEAGGWRLESALCGRVKAGERMGRRGLQYKTQTPEVSLKSQAQSITAKVVE